MMPALSKDINITNAGLNCDLVTQAYKNKPQSSISESARFREVTYK